MVNDTNKGENINKKWPVEDGRYKVGNQESCVAVCTNASIEDINLPIEKIAIIGKCLTENVGIEKIIKNIVTNPNIRYLILCGKESKGHYVSQCFVSLVKNGIDDNKKIKGAKGAMPYLKNLDKKIIERFIKQVKIVNMVNELNPEKIEEEINKCLEKNPKAFKGEKIDIEEIEKIKAEKNKEFITDPTGFFVIRINKDEEKIIVEHYTGEYSEGKIISGKPHQKIVGNTADEICHTIKRLNLIGDFKQTIEHAMYLGRELQKAEVALKNDLDYEQDKELK